MLLCVPKLISQEKMRQPFWVRGLPLCSAKVSRVLARNPLANRRGWGGAEKEDFDVFRDTVLMFCYYIAQASLQIMAILCFTNTMANLKCFLFISFLMLEFEPGTLSMLGTYGATSQAGRIDC